MAENGQRGFFLLIQPLKIRSVQQNLVISLQASRVPAMLSSESAGDAGTLQDLGEFQMRWNCYSSDDIK